MEMSRFQIEDIVEQDKHGVVFRAHDSELGRTVALRRFFPFGLDGGGLSKDEAIAFGTAAQRLSTVSHEALRSVITGSVDPIDGIPFLVTEWVDGMPLADYLSGENLDPGLVIDVLRIALEVSIILSHVLGEEAVWVETEVEAIIIGSKESGRGFTFWISPLKWIGSEHESRKLSSIVSLGEQLLGWRWKLVSDEAGYGLGGWLKWLKKNPDARLVEALEMLATSTGKAAPPSEAELVGAAISQQVPDVRQPSAGKPLLFAAIVAVMGIAATLLYFQYKAESPDIAKVESSKQAPPVTGNSAADSLPAPREAKTPPPTEEVNPIAKNSEPPAVTPSGDVEPKLPLSIPTPAPEKPPEKKPEPPPKKTPEPKPKPSPEKPPEKAPTKTPEPPPSGPVKVYTPDEKKALAGVRQGTPVRLVGVVRSVKKSGTGRSIYLFFSDPPDSTKLAGVIHQASFKGDYLEDTFMPLVGKKIALNGTCFKEVGGRVLVRITSKEQVKGVK